ncbi:MAG: hypothetical protein C4289_11265 [Chloroflexota bacterium]
MDLSIVIINHRSEPVLGRCLASIFEQPVRCACEVLLVDNSGLERGFPLVERYLPRVRLLTHAGHWGFAKNCNYGIRHSRGRHVVLLNADTTVQAGALHRLVEYLWPGRGWSTRTGGCNHRYAASRPFLSSWCAGSTWTGG